MIRIVIAQTSLRDVQGTSTKSGTPKPYHFRTQTGYAETVDEQGNRTPFPEKFDITLNLDQPAFAVGEYTLHPSSVYLDRNGRMAIQPRLTPLPRKPAA